jgi:hypothetical protein
MNEHWKFEKNPNHLDVANSFVDLDDVYYEKGEASSPKGEHSRYSFFHYD